jgi:hypothetical protein
MGESQAIRLALPFTATNMAAVAQSADQKVSRRAGLQIDRGLLETWIPLGSNNALWAFCQ